MIVINKEDYSSTMNLPKNTISTNGNLTKRQSFFLAKIQDTRRYKEVLSKNSKSSELYEILENPMIVQEKLTDTVIQNKILKDVVIRYRLLKGNKVKHNIDFIHTDDMLDNQKEKTQKLQEMINTRHEKRKELANTIIKHVKDIKDLGTVINYSNFNSSTLNADFEIRSIEKFWELYKQNKIYSDVKPVDWCPKCKRALELNNLKYVKSREKNIYVLYKVQNDNGMFNDLQNKDNTYFVATTLKPYVLVASDKIAIVEDMEYSLVEVKENDKKLHYIVATELVDNVMQAAFFIRYDIIRKINGKELLECVCYNPIDSSLPVKIIGAKREHVIFENKTSTGINVVSDGLTYFDYLISKTNGDVKIKPVLDKSGKTTKDVLKFQNMDYKEVSDKVIGKLKENSALLTIDHVIIKIPKCKECNTNIIYRPEQEWYIRKTASDEALKQCFDGIIEKIYSCKSAKKEEIRNKLYKSIDKKEMLISNESALGTPIPMFYCASCNNIIMGDEVVNILKKTFKEKGIEEWYKQTPDELLKGQVACDKCGCTFLFKGEKSINEFFKFMCIPIIKEQGKEQDGVNKNYLCIENWDLFVKRIKTLSFDESNLEIINRIYRILLHPTIEEELKSQKKETYNVKEDINNLDLISASKSINSATVVKKYGIDVIRLWCVAKSNQNKVVLKEKDIIEINRIYKRIRRAIKFLLANLYDFNPNKNMIPVQNRDDLDKYMYRKLIDLINKVDTYYSNLDIYHVYTSILKFCNNELCKDYFSLIKFRLYVLSANDAKRRSTQSMMYEIFMTLMQYVEPILPVTLEETWTYIWHRNVEEEGNLLLCRNDIQIVDDSFDEAVDKWNKMLDIRNRIKVELDKAIAKKEINKTLQAKVIISTTEEVKKFIDQNFEEIVRSFNISQLETKLSDSEQIIIQKAEGVECHRCRNYSLYIGEDINYRYLCPTCAKILSNIEKSN